jgi:magnesium transporter
VTDPVADRPDPPVAGDESQDEAVYDLPPEVVDAVVEALAAERLGDAHELVQALHYADAADLLERLSPVERSLLVGIMQADFEPELLAEVDETIRDEIVDQLGLETIAQVVSELDSDDAVQIVEELDEDEQREVLDAIPAEDRTLIEESLAYPEDSAGRLMQRELVTVPEFWTVGETIDFMRHSADGDDDALPEQFYDIFVVDPKHHPLGSIPLSRLLRTRRPVAVVDLMETEMKILPATTDQEDVAFVFSQRDLVSAPVVDDDGRLVGAITIDDVVDVIHEEHEEDIMRLGGVIEDDLYAAAIDTTRARFAWLLVNLGTAILASIVIGLFQGSIEQMVALAVLMPIVASMGGNAGTQTLTVAVRALATKELTATNAMRVIGKELIVGAFNGVLFAILTGLVALAWFDSAAIGVVIALAMIINLVVAGLAGTTVPILLDRAGIDPAIASSVVLTTITDVIGFFAFLGLAAALLL